MRKILFFAVALLLSFYSLEAQITFSANSGHAVNPSLGYARVDLKVANHSYSDISDIQFTTSFSSPYGGSVLAQYTDPGARNQNNESGENIGWYTHKINLETTALGWKNLNTFWIINGGALPINTTPYTLVEVYFKFAVPSNLRIGDKITVSLNDFRIMTKNGQVITPTNGALMVDIYFGGTNSVEENIVNSMPTKVYPQPANNFLNLDYNLLQPGLTEIVITDISGQEVMRQSNYQSIGNQTWNLPLSLTDGVYYYSLYQEKYLLNSGKFIVH